MYEQTRRVEQAFCIPRHGKSGGVGFKIDLRQICEPVVKTEARFCELLILHVRYENGGWGVVGKSSSPCHRGSSELELVRVCRLVELPLVCFMLVRRHRISYLVG